MPVQCQESKHLLRTKKIGDFLQMQKNTVKCTVYVLVDGRSIDVD